MQRNSYSGFALSIMGKDYGHRIGAISVFVYYLGSYN